MPVEIRELNIKVNVNQPTEGTGSTAVGASPASQTDAGNKQAIIAACVEEVLSILKQKAER